MIEMVLLAEKAGEIRFLHHLKAGPATKSYGIHVAKLAGVPKLVIERAQMLLKELESQKSKVSPQMSLLDFGSSDSLQNNDLESGRKQLLYDKIIGLDLKNMTPLQVMSKISEFQQEIS